MTETQTQTQISIPELQKAAREAAQQERQLAQEVDALPEKIQEAARNDARSKARAARSGATVAAVDETSAVPKLRQREAELPILRWSAAIRVGVIRSKRAPKVRISRSRALSDTGRVLRAPG